MGFSGVHVESIWLGIARGRIIDRCSRDWHRAPRLDDAPRQCAGCVIYGPTIEHALAMAQELADSRVARMIEARDEIPGETEASLVGTGVVRVTVSA
jgi:hypothetical protein